MYKLRISNGKTPIREKLAQVVTVIGNHLLNGYLADDLSVKIDYGNNPTIPQPNGIVVSTSSNDVVRLCISRWGASHC